MDGSRRVNASIGAEEASIFDAHLLALEDPVLVDEVTRLIRKDKINAEHAFQTVAKKYAEAMDPFVSLTAAAVATKTLKVGTGVCLVAQRDPIQTAKLVASIDQISGGRFLFGIGTPRRWPITGRSSARDSS